MTDLEILERMKNDPNFYDDPENCKAVAETMRGIFRTLFGELFFEECMEKKNLTPLMGMYFMKGIDVFSLRTNIEIERVCGFFDTAFKEYNITSRDFVVQTFKQP